MLIVGPVGDALEREADRAAARAMAGWAVGPLASPRGALVQRVRRQSEEDVRAGAVAPASVADALQGDGRALEPTARGFFEARFGHDFSHIRIHDDARASHSAREIGAAAYTVGDDIVIGRGQPDERSPEGRYLIAHELAHAIQQRGGPRVVQRRRLGSCTPAEDNVRPRAPWADLQREYQRRCGTQIGNLRQDFGRMLRDLRQRRAPRPPRTPDARSTIDCACANMEPENAARASMARVAAAGPLAARLFYHFLDGSGTEMTIDVADMINRSEGVRRKIRQSMTRGRRVGHTRLSQSDYGVQELQFAYGAIDCVRWEVLSPRGRRWRSDPSARIRVSMLDYYEFHPHRPGVSQCAHAACVELVARGSARNFWTSGSAEVALVTIDPSIGGSRRAGP